MDDSDLTTDRVDHLPMVAQFLDDIGMVETIDSQVGVHPNEILSTGQTAAAMVVMALGFVSRPLYLSPQFFESKALGLIIGKSKTDKTPVILPEHLNDDKLGRTLDEIYDLGPDTLFQTVAFAAARREKLNVPSLHVDTTTHSFYGSYDDDTAAGVSGRADSTEPCHATVEYGFSKDMRHDCKQLVQELLVSSDGDVPLMVKIHSGNESDVKVFQERVKDLKKQFVDASDLMPEFIAADSKFYNETNVKACDQESPWWVTRVPDNITEAKEAFAEAYASQIWTSLQTGKGKDIVRYREVAVDRYGVPQRFIVVVSDSGLRRARSTVERQTKAEAEQLEKSARKLARMDFACAADAELAAAELFDKVKYHRLTGRQLSTENRYRGKGRPKGDSIPISTVRVTVTFEKLEPPAIEEIVWKKAMFIVGTNNTTSSAERVMSIYRKDQQGVERAFRFLKSPMYFADAFFFKNTKRIVALLTLMTIALLVYSLLQRKLRLAIAQRSQPIPDQKGKPTTKPTMNWVNQCFEGIDLIRQRGKLGVRYVFVRLGSFAKQVLSLLGPQYTRRYSVEMLL